MFDDRHRVRVVLERLWCFLHLLVLLVLHHLMLLLHHLMVPLCLLLLLLLLLLLVLLVLVVVVVLLLVVLVVVDWRRMVHLLALVPMLLLLLPPPLPLLLLLLSLPHPHHSHRRITTLSVYSLATIPPILFCTSFATVLMEYGGHCHATISTSLNRKHTSSATSMGICSPPVLAIHNPTPCVCRSNRRYDCGRC
jgi:hypothetical protein